MAPEELLSVRYKIRKDPAYEIIIDPQPELRESIEPLESCALGSGRKPILRKPMKAARGLTVKLIARCETWPVCHGPGSDVLMGNVGWSILRGSWLNGAGRLKSSIFALREAAALGTNDQKRLVRSDLRPSALSGSEKFSRTSITADAKIFHCRS